MKVLLISLLTTLLAGSPAAYSAPAGYVSSGRSLIVTDAQGTQLRITAYGGFATRLQLARAGEDFFADDRYEMVESHAQGGQFEVQATATEIRLIQSGGARLTVDRASLAVSYFAADGTVEPLLQELGAARCASTCCFHQASSEGRGESWSCALSDSASPNMDLGGRRGLPVSWM